MNKIVSYLLMIFIFLLCSTTLFAQNNGPETENIMRSSGKIYVVVAVCLTILIGIFIYVFLLDRRIRRLENNKD